MDILIEYSWAFIGLFFLFIELATPGIFFAFILSIAAFLTFVSSQFLGGFTYELFTFILFSIILLLFVRPIFIKLTAKSAFTQSHHEGLVTRLGTVTKRISPANHGIVKVEGQEWTAISNETIEVGESVKIEKIDGISFYVSKNQIEM